MGVREGGVEVRRSRSEGKEIVKEGRCGVRGTKVGILKVFYTNLAISAQCAVTSSSWIVTHTVSGIATTKNTISRLKCE